MRRDLFDKLQEFRQIVIMVYLARMLYLWFIWRASSNQFKRKFVWNSYASCAIGLFM